MEERECVEQGVGWSMTNMSDAGDSMQRCEGA